MLSFYTMSLKNSSAINSVNASSSVNSLMRVEGEESCVLSSLSAKPHFAFMHLHMMEVYPPRHILLQLVSVFAYRCYTRISTGAALDFRPTLALHENDAACSFI